MTSGPSEPPRGGSSGVPGTRAHSPVSAPLMAPCPACGSPVQSDLPFCGKCGKRLSSAAAARACPNCGRPNDQGFAFCPACGTAIAGAPPEPASPFQLATKKASKGAELLLLDRGGASHPAVSAAHLGHHRRTAGRRHQLPGRRLPLSGARPVPPARRHPQRAGPGQQERHLALHRTAAPAARWRHDPHRQPGPALPPARLSRSPSPGAGPDPTAGQPHPQRRHRQPGPDPGRWQSARHRSPLAGPLDQDRARIGRLAVPLRHLDERDARHDPERGRRLRAGGPGQPQRGGARGPGRDARCRKAPAS